MPNYTLYYFNGRGRAEICRMLFAAAGVKYTDKRFEFSEWERYKKDMPCMCVPVLEIDGKFKMPETLAIARYLAREFGFYGRSPMDMMRCDYICDCFYELMHDYMRYYHWKNGRFRFSGHGMGSVTPSGGMSRGAVMSSGSMSTGRITSGGTVSSGMASGGITSVGVSSGGVSSGGVSSGGVSSGGVSSGGVSSGGMVTSRMSSSGMSSSGVTSGGMVSSDMSGYDKYMYWRYMNTCNRVLPFLEKTLSVHKSGNQFFMGEQMMWCDMMCYCCLENPYMENQSMFSNYPKLMALRTRVASHQKISTYLKGRSHTMW